jgi:hypothetical protein
MIHPAICVFFMVTDQINDGGGAVSLQKLRQ